MFRDGIFDNFGEFLDRINESVPRVDEEESNLLTFQEWMDSKYSKDGSNFISGELAEDGYRFYLETNLGKPISDEKMKEIGKISRLTSDPLPSEYESTPQEQERKEFKLQEQERKEAEQTEQPTEETPKDDAERLSMEDWSDTDKDGIPKRVDKVERPTELHQVKDEELSQEVTYERKNDPLYLCNECFKTFRASSPVCKCGSKVVERIGKVKEAYKEQHPGSYTVTFFNKHKEKIPYAETQKDAAAKAREIYKKEDRILGVHLDKRSDESKVEEEYQEKYPGRYEVIFYDGHKEVVDADSKWDAKQKAKELYSGEQRIEQVNMLSKSYSPSAEPEKSLQWTKENKVGEEETFTAPKVKMTTGQGTSYYAHCPKCNKTNWLSGELTTGDVVCKKCYTPFKLGDEVEHEDYIKRGVSENVEEGKWKLHGLSDKELKRALSHQRELQGLGLHDEELIGELEKAISTYVEESKLEEQGDAEALRNRRMEIEQKMLDLEKKFREEQNRLGTEVDRLNQQIKAKEETK